MMTEAMKLKDIYSLEGKVMTNLDSILKSRDITLPTKVHIVKAMVFPVVHLHTLLILVFPLQLTTCSFSFEGMFE